MKLLQIPPEITDQVWPVMEPFLARACKFTRGTQTPESLRGRIKTSGAQLWAVIEDEKPHKVVAAGATSIVEYPTGAKVLMIELLSGENMKVWLPLKNELEDWAKQNGCNLSYFWGRKGLIGHLPDYHLTHYMLHKDLTQ